MAILCTSVKDEGPMSRNGLENGEVGESAVPVKAVKANLPQSTQRDTEETINWGRARFL